MTTVETTVQTNSKFRISWTNSKILNMVYQNCDTADEKFNSSTVKML
jgi:hypothetical protein